MMNPIPNICNDDFRFLPEQNEYSNTVEYEILNSDYLKYMKHPKNRTKQTEIASQVGSQLLSS